MMIVIRESGNWSKIKCLPYRTHRSNDRIVQARNLIIMYFFIVHRRI